MAKRAAIPLPFSVETPPVAWGGVEAGGSASREASGPPAALPRDALLRTAPPAPVEPPDAPPPSRPRVRVIGAQLPESQPEEGLKISEVTRSIIGEFLKDQKSSGKS